MDNTRRKPNYNFLVLDMEMNQPSGDIIQIGAVAGDLSTGKVHAMFNKYVRINESVRDSEPKYDGDAINIVKLTKITDHILQTKGVSLKQAAQDLKEFREKNNLSLLPAAWGDDYEYLMKRLDSRGLKVNIFGEKKYDNGGFDIKRLYQNYRLAQGKSLQGGVSSACKNLGIPFKGTKHNALDDALNTFMIWHELFKKIKID